jgi:hypothetical protein
VVHGVATVPFISQSCPARCVSSTQIRALEHFWPSSAMSSRQRTCVPFLLPTRQMSIRTLRSLV